jgi:hypothetical protein
MGRLLPNILGVTAFNYGLQGALTDASGNGNALTVESGTADFVTIDACTQAFETETIGGAFNSLVAAASPTFQFTGEFTFQCAFRLFTTNTQTFVQCETPGGMYLWALYIVAAVRIAYADHNVNAALSPDVVMTSYASTRPAPVTHTLGIRRRQTSAGHWIVECFLDGAKQTGTLATTPANVPGGTEVLRIAGHGGTGNINSDLWSIRGLSYARSDADMLADHNLIVAACASPLNYRGALIQIRGAS